MWQQYQMIGEIFFRFHTKLHWKKKKKKIAVSCKCMDWNTHDISGDSEAMLSFFGCSKFSVQVYSTSHVLRANICDQLIGKIQLSWADVICIKRCFLHTNQWLLLHVLAVISKVTKIIQYTDVCFWRSFFCAFSVCDDCILKSTTAWLLKLSVLYIHSFMQVHNTTFEIKTVFNSVLFSTEVHNPLHAHLLALSHIYICSSQERLNVKMLFYCMWLWVLWLKLKCV